MTIQWLGKSSFRIRGGKAKLEIKPPQVKIDNFVIDSPGEYEIKDVYIQALDKIYLIELDNIRLCHLEKECLTDENLEAINGVDILLIPAKMVKMVNQIEPKIVIPMAYTSPSQFLKEMGTAKKPIEKLQIKKKDLPKEETEVCLLKKP